MQHKGSLLLKSVCCRIGQTELAIPRTYYVSIQSPATEARRIGSYNYNIHSNMLKNSLLSCWKLGIECSWSLSFLSALRKSRYRESDKNAWKNVAASSCKCPTQADIKILQTRSQVCFSKRTVVASYWFLATASVRKFRKGQGMRSQNLLRVLKSIYTDRQYWTVNRSKQYLATASDRMLSFRKHYALIL